MHCIPCKGFWDNKLARKANIFKAVMTTQMFMKLISLNFITFKNTAIQNHDQFHGMN